METRTEPQKHSGLGIASFVISLVTGVCLFLILVVAGVLETTTPGGIDETSAIAVVIGLFMFAFMGVALLALGLGLGGLFQADRKKVFAILGIVFSATAFIGTFFIILLGLAME